MAFSSLEEVLMYSQICVEVVLEIGLGALIKKLLKYS